MGNQSGRYGATEKLNFEIREKEKNKEKHLKISGVPYNRIPLLFIGKLFDK